MKSPYKMTDDEILEELFSDMTQAEIDAWVKKCLTGRE